MAFTKFVITYALAAVVVAEAAYATRRPGEPLKPGFNLFSKEQDVRLGETNAKQVTAQYQVADNRFLQGLCASFGGRLAAAPEARQSGSNSASPC